MKRPYKTYTKPKLEPITIDKIKGKGVSQQQINILKQCFKQIDNENLGTIQIKEFKIFLNESELKKNHQLQIAYLDILENTYNQVQIDEIRFIDVMTKKIKYLKDKEDYKILFSIFDFQKTGYISLKNIREISKKFCNQMIRDSDLNQMMKKFDVDQDGLISQIQFKNIFLKDSTQQDW